MAIWRIWGSGDIPRGVQHVGRSMQARAALTPGVSQQAFKHATGIRVAGVISIRSRTN